MDTYTNADGSGWFWYNMPIGKIEYVPYVQQLPREDNFYYEVCPKCGNLKHKMIYGTYWDDKTRSYKERLQVTCQRCLYQHNKECGNYA